MFILHETASGYALFMHTDDASTDTSDLSRFSKTVKLVSFAPFQSAAHALENINAVSDAACHAYLSTFLNQNVAKKGVVAVLDPKLGNAIQEACPNIKVTASETAQEIIRGVRSYLTRFLTGVEDADIVKAQLGLAHSYSRSKVKFNVHRSDNMIIQAIALLDQLDKDVNTFAMRVREWYGWHFPELVKIVNDNYMYARLALLIGNKSSVSDKDLAGITEVVHDEAMAKDVLAAAKMSMGTDLSEIDMANISHFAQRVINLAEYRLKLSDYLHEKMQVVAPNLQGVVGDVVGARLISHAGSLTNLAKAPASTIQILGAEKALFRALKTKGKTPKYGILFHTSFIGKAKPRDKGRISRYVANKCAVASRIDCFSDVPVNVFGETLRTQVEDRLRFYETGEAPKKNVDVMHAAQVKANEIIAKDAKEKKAEKRSAEKMVVDHGSDDRVAEPEKKKSKKEKEEKKEEKSKDKEEKKEKSKDKEEKKEKSKDKEEKKEKSKDKEEKKEKSKDKEEKKSKKEK
eukprot:ANDGO_03763.mRNA.1 Nucleolar protein 56